MKRQDHQTEWMDRPQVEPGELAQALRFIRRVNRYLGGTAAVMGHLQAWEKGSQPLTILDVATGSGDIPEAILRWSHRRRREVHVLALDLHATTLALARDWTLESSQRYAPSRLSFLRGDALALPLADGSVDYAIASMFMHHLPERCVPEALGEMIRVSRRGVIVNDLLRSHFARWSVWWMTLFSSPIDRHDARVSIEKAWVRREVLGWAQELGASSWLSYRAHRFGRFTLAGRKS